MNLQTSELRCKHTRPVGRRPRGRAPIRRIGSGLAAGTLFLAGLGAVITAPAQANTLTFNNYTTTNGLGSNIVNGVFVDGSTIYAATNGGLSISTDGGANFTNRTTANGLGSNVVIWVYAVGSTVYAATGVNLGTGGGISVSTNGGNTFTTYTTADGLGDNQANGVYAVGSTVYAATASNTSAVGGLSISTNLSDAPPLHQPHDCTRTGR
jgi:hypothetical protein